MKKIEHIVLGLEPVQGVSMRYNSEVLGLITKGGKPTLCVLADESEKLIGRKFLIFAEGKEIPQRLNITNFIGTFETDGHILHVFEE